MPVHPNPGQVDGHNRLMQSPMATQGYSQQMMPPPNSMGSYLPTSGKGAPGSQMTGPYPPYGSQYPPGGYGKQQPGNMGGMSGPPSSGPMQSYPGPQPNMYPKGGGHMPGMAMYGGMSGMSRNMVQQGGYPPPGSYTQGGGNMGGVVSNHFPGYTTSMGPMAGQHSMQQQSSAGISGGPVPAGSAPGVMTSNINGQPPGAGMSQQYVSSKVVQAQTNSTAPRLSYSQGSMSPSRGMFAPSSGGPMGHMTSGLTDSPNLGSPSLNSMASAMEQLTRVAGGGPMSSSALVNLPMSKHQYPSSMSGSMPGNLSDIDRPMGQSSPLTTSESHEPLSRPNSVSAHHAEHASSESTTGLDSGCLPCDSASVDSGFHSSDQSDKTSDSVSTPSHPGTSPPLLGAAPNGELSGTSSPPVYPSHPHHPQQPLHHMHPHHHPHLQQPHYHMHMEPKLSNSEVGIPLSSSAMTSMPSSSNSVVTLANAGPSLTSVTQSIASPVTSVSTYTSQTHQHPHNPPHMGPGPHAGPPHNSPHMGPGPHAGPPHMMSHGMGSMPMMQNGMPPNGMMMGGPGQMQSNLAGPMHGMMHPGMNMSQNGPMMGPMMSHNGPMMPGMNSSSNVPSMGQMPQHHQQQSGPGTPSGKSKSKKSSAAATSEEPPEKKRKIKDQDGLGGARSSSVGAAHITEELDGPGPLKSPAADVAKLFEMGPEPDRRQFLERIFAYLEETGQPVTALPFISKIPLDLYKLYYGVKEKGGFEEVTRSKKWRDICVLVNIGTSASAAFTLKKNYIRYFLNFECKYDRGGINPAPILAQMEAQLAQKREQKSKRAPSPAGSSSNDSFRPPSVPNTQGELPYPGQNLPPPYMQNPDSGVPSPHMSGSHSMGPNSLMSGMPRMAGGPRGMGPSPLMGVPGSGMMHGQQGMMPNAGSGNMMGPHMSGEGPGYGGHLMSSQMAGNLPPMSTGPAMSHGVSSQTGGSVTVNSDGSSSHSPYSGEAGFSRQCGTPLQSTPPPPPHGLSTSLPVSSFPGMQQSSSAGNGPITATAGQSGLPTPGYAGLDPTTNGNSSGGRPRDSSPLPGGSAHFPPGQALERSDRFEPSAPGMIRPAPTSGLPQGQPATFPLSAESVNMYPAGRFPVPFQPHGMRPSLPGSDAAGPFPAAGAAGYQAQSGYGGVQYPPNYSQPAAGTYPGPRPTSGPGPAYGTPTKRFPEDHPDRMQDCGPWSPAPRSRVPPGYMSPVPPSTPPSAPTSHQAGHKVSPQSRDTGQLSGQPKVLTPFNLAPPVKKEVVFPPGCVESITFSTVRRKKLTSKDLDWQPRRTKSVSSVLTCPTSYKQISSSFRAPFEPWRLMLALKSGLLAESTWALDTLNILLFDDATMNFFGLGTLPGLLEVLTEHFRHCLMQIFPEFKELEQGLSTSPPAGQDLSMLLKAAGSETELGEGKKLESFQLTRNGLKVKVNNSPVDCSVIDTKEWDKFSGFELRSDHWAAGQGDITCHIMTHMESEHSNEFLSRQFRKRQPQKNDKLQESSSEIVCQTANSVGQLSEQNVCTDFDDIDRKVTNQQQTSSSLPTELEGCNQRQPVLQVEQIKSEVEGSNHSVMCNSESLLVPTTNSEFYLSSEVSTGSDVKSQEMQEPGTVQGSLAGPAVDVKLQEEEAPMETQESARVSSEAQSLQDACTEKEDKKCQSLPISNPENSLSGNDSCGKVEKSLFANKDVSSFKNKKHSENTDKTSFKAKGDECSVTIKSEVPELQEKVEPTLNDSSINNSMDISLLLNESFTSETEELSASVVAEMMKEDEHVEEEAFQRDDPPLCVTPESRDELGRRCVCISNIIRSLSFVPGNEDHICKFPGIMRILGKLLLLHHTHAEKPLVRKLPYSAEEDEDREHPPRVYDDEHWWWHYIDQLRENTLVILANVCAHLQLGHFAEEICLPLLEGLLHWVICPASVARDPLPTLPADSMLSPQRLVLEALCKLCIHEANVDLLLATPPVRRLLDLFKVLIHLLADGSHQITQEFSIVLLSLLISGDTSAARAVALQHSSVSVLIDFLENAEQTALTVANQQGIEVLQLNPEVIGTSVDMLRRAATILLQMARIPDNRRMFVQQQSRLLNLVMSRILDQSVTNVLSEVLFECSQLVS